MTGRQSQNGAMLEQEDDDLSDPKNCRYTDKKPNLWDRFTFGYLTGVITRGASNRLEAKDLRPLHTVFTANDASQKIFGLFARKREKIKRKLRRRTADSSDSSALIQEEENGPKVNMIWLLVQAFWPQLLLVFILNIIGTIGFLATPAAIGFVYDFLSDANADTKWGYYIALGLFVAQQLESMSNAHIYCTLYNVGIKCRSGFSAVIYQKSLRLSSKSRKEFSTGDIVNMISVDLENVMWAMTLSLTLIETPILIPLTFYLIYQYLGIYALAGAVTMVVFSPLTGLAAKIEAKLQAKQMKIKDERVKLLTEVINNIKIIKLYAYENSFVKRIRDIRQHESRVMSYYLATCNAFGFIWNCYPFLISISAISAYLYLDREDVLNAKQILVAISYFNSMKFALTNFPYTVGLLVKSVVSLRRIRSFLGAEEVDPELIRDDLGDELDISIKNGTFNWNEESNVLKDIDLDVSKGELLAIVGPVAAGKSSLISSIIGEMKCSQGSINRRPGSSIAYVPQEAWILNNTIRENITFGSEFKSRKYQSILSKCCLLPDLKILNAGDQTEIGEKGINLSGGQKQRLSLARAAYQGSDIYLLDDPLSAVDAHVAQALFKDIIGPEGLLQNKTRILVTHTVSILPYVDRIAVMQDGKITHQGTFEEIMVSNPKLKELVSTHTATEQSAPSSDKPPELPTARKPRTASIVSVGSTGSSCFDHGMSNNRDGVLIDEEFMQEGNVRWKVYVEFLWNFGIFGTIIMLLGFIAFNLSENASYYYISMWGEQMKENNKTSIPDVNQHLEVYLAFGGAQAASILIALTTLALGCVWSSTSLHNRMLVAVMNSPMSFFESTPTGRILNRFSRDVDELDVSLYGVLDGYLETLIACVVSIAIVSVQLPQILAMLLPLLAAFLTVQRFYLGSSRQIKRLNAITKSPVLNLFGESIAGASSIRAYGAQDQFRDKNMRSLDNNQNCMFHEYQGYRWLAIRLNLCGTLISASTVCLLTYYRGSFTPAIAALILSFALQASTSFTWIVRLGAQVENSLVSAERVLEYTKVKPEAPKELQDDVEDGWPSRGRVQFDGYSTRYRENTDLVINGIDLTVEAGEKVGIVGRTGAGKSSLTLALLRIIESAGGRIVIDGVDISKVGLHTLRSRIAIIPQDPVLFRGTLRLNIDPENAYSDEDIWAALERAHLKTKEKGLDYEIDEGGSNLSVGERQLICLARALLRKSKILILDEATAAVDLETDALIQGTIREDFKECTVITIAHRLHTIMDYDKIVVMDRGEISEVGSPQELLEKDDGRFRAMAREANISSE